MAKISIILPIYNVAKYLPRCVDSVLNQTLKDIEVILATDGPEDCDKICADYAKKDKRVKVISHPGGYGKSVNQGIDIAKGKYVGIVETDDWCDSTMFEKLYSAAEKYQADVAKCGFYFSYDFNPRESKNAMEIQDGCFNPMEHLELLRFQPSVWSAIYLKKFLDQNNIRFMEEKKLSYIDSPFHEETFVKAKKYVSLSEPLYFYYQDNPAQSVKSSKKIFDGIKAEEFIFNKLSENKELFGEIKEFFMETTALHLRWNWNRMQTEEDKKAFWEAAHNYVKRLNFDGVQFTAFYDKSLKDFLLYLKKYENYKEYIHMNYKVSWIKILNIPFLKITSQKGKDLSVFLFNKIPLFKIKYRANKTTFRLFNLLPILTVKKDKEKKIKLIHKIFSIKNEGKHKIIRMLGLKIKFKTFKKVTRYYDAEIENLKKTIQSLQMTIEQNNDKFKNSIDKLKNTLKINALPLEDIRLIPEHLQEKYALDHFDIKVRKGTSDISVVYDVLQKKVYACTDTSYDVEIIIDAGANIGCASVYYAQRYPNAKIYALEPEKENYKLLVENVSKYPNVIPLNIGLMGTDCTLKVVDNNNGAWGYEIRNDGNVINDVECCTVNSLIKKFNMKKVDILKIDIEGAEASVFQNLENINFDKIDMISIELHDRLRGGSSNSFFNAIARHPEYELDYVYTENLVFRKQHTNKL
ncbi:MAG: FkbM family methyltransferase [Alphaproteobacteria bacterium]|nr:FkbM family methyltransferase [Alphaproteobacteria bacterium]